MNSYILLRLDSALKFEEVFKEQFNILSALTNYNHLKQTKSMQEVVTSLHNVGKELLNISECFITEEP
jgi:hypothetical protein